MANVNENGRDFATVANFSRSKARAYLGDIHINTVCSTCLNLNNQKHCNCSIFQKVPLLSRQFVMHTRKEKTLLFA